MLFILFMAVSPTQVSMRSERLARIWFVSVSRLGQVTMDMEGPQNLNWRNWMMFSKDYQGHKLGIIIERRQGHSWGSCQNAGFGSANLGQGLRFCILRKSPDDADATSPGATLWVANVKLIFAMSYSGSFPGGAWVCCNEWEMRVKAWARWQPGRVCNVKFREWWVCSFSRGIVHPWLGIFGKGVVFYVFKKWSLAQFLMSHFILQPDLPLDGSNLCLKKCKWF